MIDAEAVVDCNIVTGRTPAEIPACTLAFIWLVEAAEAEQPA